MNKELRTKAKNNFEKDLFKLINNLVFGKTLENKRKIKGNIETSNLCQIIEEDVIQCCSLTIPQQSGF